MVDDKELTCRDFGRLLCREAGWNFLPSNIPAPPAKEQESTEHFGLVRSLNSHVFDLALFPSQLLQPLI